MPPARPRRSTAAAVDYTAFLPPRDSSSSSSSASSDNENIQPQAGPSTAPGDGEQSASPSVKKKDKPKRERRRATYIPSGSSGSEFDAAAISSAAEEDDAISEDVAATSSDDGAGPKGGDGSELSGSIATSGSETDEGSGGPRRVTARGGRRGRGRGGSAAASSARQNANFAPSSSRLAAGSGGAGAPRTRPPANWPQNGWDPQYPGSGPLATLVPSATLSRGKEGLADAEVVLLNAGQGEPDKGKGKGKLEARARGGLGLTDREVSVMMETWTANPFLGPSRRSARDVGWGKGKWIHIEDEGEGEAYEEAEDWGGRYEEVPDGALGDEVDPDDLSRYLPQQLPSLQQPSERYTISVRPDGASPALEPSATPATDFGGLPVPPAQVSIGADAETAQNGDERQEGSVTLLVGGVKDAKKEERSKPEQKIELERFESVRLDSYVDKKPGHLLNAGGPVNSVAWAPRARSTEKGGPRKEYLALSTISTLDTPLRHSSLSTNSPTLETLINSPAFNGHLPSSSSFAPPQPASMLQIWSLSLGDEPASDELDVETATEGNGGEAEAMDKDGENGSGARADGREKKRRMRLELGICIEEGREGDAWDVQWCPCGGSGRKGEGEEAVDVDDDDGEGGAKKEGRIGLLGAVHKDGSIAVWEVPRPEKVREQRGTEDDGKALFVTARPLVSLRLPNTSIFSFAWASHETIAGGCSNGWIAVWRVGEVLKKGGMGEGSSPLRPTHFFPAHSSAIRSLVLITTPPPSLSSVDAAALYDHDAEPTGVISVGHDGSTVLSDLRNPMGPAAVLNHERCPAYTAAFSPHAGCVVIGDQEDRVKLLYLKPSELGGSKRIVPHRGAILSVAASAHHPFILSTSIDGSCVLTSGLRALRKRRVKGHFAQKLFRVEANRKTGEIRVWDNLDVEYRHALDPANPYAKLSKSKSKQKKKDKSAAAAAANDEAKDDDGQLDEEDLHTAAWPVEQGVLKAAWHPAIERAGLCATGWACGIARVDWCEDREV